MNIPSTVSDEEIAEIAYSLEHSFSVIDPEFRSALATIFEKYIHGEYVQEVDLMLQSVMSNEKFTLKEKVNFIRELTQKRTIPRSEYYPYFNKVVSELTPIVRKAREML